MADQERVTFTPLKWLSNKTLSFHNKGSLKSPSGRALSSSKSTPSHENTPRRSCSTTPPRDPYSEELKQVFRYFDSDGDGKVSALELRAYFGSVGEYVSHENAQALVDEVDSDGDGFLGFDDFLRMMRRDRHCNSSTNNEGRDDGDEDDDLKTAFEMFEMEKGSGCITPKGLQKMLRKLGDARSYDECVAMIRVYDIDGNGVLDFHEFHQMMIA